MATVKQKQSELRKKEVHEEWLRGHTTVRIVPDAVYKQSQMGINAKKPISLTGCICATCGAMIKWKRQPDLTGMGDLKLIAFCDQTCYENYNDQKTKKR